MPRLRCFDGDFGSFQVADFADHDDVRILSEEGFKRHWESQALPVVDIDLVNPRQGNFSWVFGCRDIDAGFVENVDACV